MIPDERHARVTADTAARWAGVIQLLLDSADRADRDDEGAARQRQPLDGAASEPTA